MKHPRTAVREEPVREPSDKEVDDYLVMKTGSSLRDWKGWARVQAMIELEREQNETAKRRARWKEYP